MGVDRACALAGQVITNVKGPYLFYRGNVKTKKLTPDGEFSVPTQGKRQVPTRTWYTSRAPTGQMTVAAREKATALPTPLLSAWPNVLTSLSRVKIDRWRAEVTITRESVSVYTLEINRLHSGAKLRRTATRMSAKKCV
jgi:hypothetical protein